MTRRPPPGGALPRTFPPSSFPALAFAVVLALVLAVLVAAPAVATAKGAHKAKTKAVTVGMFVPEAVGELPAEAKKIPEALASILNKEIAAAGFKISALASLSDSLVTLGCAAPDADCLARLADTADVDYLATASLAPEGGKLHVRVAFYAGGVSVGPGVDKVVDAAAVGSLVVLIRAAVAALPKAPAAAGTDAGTGTGTGSGTGTAGTGADAGTIEVTTDPPGASVSLDGAPRGTAPLALDAVPAGVHTVEATMAGRTRATTTVLVEAGVRVPAALTLAPAEAIVAGGSGTGAGAAAASGGGGGARVPAVGLAVAGVGVVALGGSVFTGLVTSRTADAFEGHAMDTVEDFRDLEDLESRGKLFARLTQVLIVVGAAAILGGGALILKDLLAGGRAKPAPSGGAEPAAPAGDPDDPLATPARSGGAR
ncbi:MAG TPA: PEGA domain-containing protein [Myxococcota bacterium]|jgi:hypothetical protein|nr:PEGA domain-containing protein [Myxococcota bacterium]